MERKQEQLELRILDGYGAKVYKARINLSNDNEVMKTFLMLRKYIDINRILKKLDEEEIASYRNIN